LKKDLTKDKDLITDEDVRIEFQLNKGDVRDIKCKNLYLENDSEKFDFNGWDFNGRNFDGKKISYYASFVAYYSIKCTEIKGRRKNSFHKCLDGKIIVNGKELKQ
jgi:hypothetical protein